MKYLCEDCCNLLGISFFGTAENKVGRKCCSRCGANVDWELETISDSAYTKAMIEGG